MERFQRWIHRNADHSHRTAIPVDVEKSLADGSSGAPLRRFANEQDDHDFSPTPAPDPALRRTAEEQLRAFRHLIGITNDRSLSQRAGIAQLPRSDASGSRAATNVGLYARVVHNEKVAKDGHKWYSLLINAALGLQIVVAAALTALGAADGSRTAVTVFGAVNTVIAGFLTYLKGSGLPSRLKYYQNEWKKLREYIEQRERDFSRAVHGGGLPPPDAELQAEVMLIERMYMETKTDIEVNTPDGYTSISKASQSRHVFSSTANPQQQPLAGGYPTRGLHFPEQAHLPSNILQQGSGFASKLQGALGQLEKHLPKEQQPGQGGNQREGLVADLEHLLPTDLTQKLKRLSARVEGNSKLAANKATEASNAATDMIASGISSAERAVDGAEKAVNDTKDNVSRHTTDVARDLESYERAVQEARRRVENLAGRFTKDIHDSI